MKQVYVIRHADKNKETNQLTDEGRKRAEILKEKIGPFTMVITSDRERTKETASLLTGEEPYLDSRAGFFYFSKEQEEEVRSLAKSNPYSYAGVIFSDKKYQALAVALGENLLELIQETLEKLPKDGKALIVSQDGVMIAGEKLLLKKSFDKLERYFLPLQGFVVDEKLHTTIFSTS